MVRRAERPRLHERPLRRQKAHHRVDLCDLQRLFPRHIRQDGRDTLGEHALARTRRADQQDVMSARCSDLQRALRVLLPLHIRKVRQKLPFRLRFPARGRFHRLLAREMRRQLPHRLHAVDRQSVGQRGLRRIFRRDVQLLHAKLPRRQRHRQHAAHRPQLAFQTQLTEERALRLRQTDEFTRREDTEQDRQIIERAGFFRARGGQIQCDPADREPEAAVFHRCAHALPCLFDGGVRQADDLKARQPVRNITFHRDLIAPDPIQSHRPYPAEHTHVPSLVFSVSYHTAFLRKSQLKFPNSPAPGGIFPVSIRTHRIFF